MTVKLTMCEKIFKKFWCYTLFLLVVPSSQSEQSVTSNEEKNDNFTIQYEPDNMTSATDYGDKMKTLSNDLYEKSTINIQYDNMQYESRITSMSNDDSIRYKRSTPPVIHNHNKQMDNKQISMESQTNSTNANYKRNFKSQEIYGNLMNIKDKNNSMSNEISENPSKVSNISNIVSYETCQHNNITCIQLCCPLGDGIKFNNKCIPGRFNKYSSPNVYEYTNNLLQRKNKVDKLFQLTVYNQCQGNRRYLLYNHQYDRLFTNGSLYLFDYEIFITSYCLLAMINEDRFVVIICSKIDIIDKGTKRSRFVSENLLIDNAIIIYVHLHIVSVLILVSIFLVYSVLSVLTDFRNINTFMLRNYCGTLSIAYTMDIVNILIKSKVAKYFIYTIGTAYLNHIIM